MDSKMDAFIFFLEKFQYSSEENFCLFLCLFLPQKTPLGINEVSIAGSEMAVAVTGGKGFNTHLSSDQSGTLFGVVLRSAQGFPPALKRTETLSNHIFLRV